MCSSVWLYMAGCKWFSHLAGWLTVGYQLTKCTKQYRHDMRGAK
uniref:Uncharacterized protein n=1 Tax=Anguilla anguilla TaxID=7936 RepID=A0A0E9PRF5_ANGAN